MSREHRYMAGKWDAGISSVIEARMEGTFISTMNSVETLNNRGYSAFEVGAVPGIYSNLLICNTAK